MSHDSLAELEARLLAFAQARDWEPFHSPKNLSMALIAEAAELVEHFQWLNQDQSYLREQPEKREAVAMELADIFIFTIRCAQRLDIDLLDAAHRKTSLNEKRYPAERVKGDARRASEYESP